jgi:arylsulfatase A-like enzyme
MKDYIIFTILSVGSIAVQAQNKKPNVLFIVVDDLRPVLGTYDYPAVKSPNIDKLASEGIQFNHAYCNVPVCGASRASLLTGLRPHYPNRFVNWDSWAEKECPGIVSLPEAFKNNNYTTVSNGKVFHHQYDMSSSWSKPPWRPDTISVIHYADLDYTDSTSIAYMNKKTGAGPYFECSTGSDSLYFDNMVTAKSIKDMKELGSAGKPFFLAVGYHKPHLPFNAPKRFYDLYDSVEIAANRFAPINLPNQVKNSTEIFVYGRTDDYNSTEFHHEARRAYYACVSYVDDQIGILLQSLKDLGLEKNTIVVILGDHGWHLGEHNFWGKHNVLYNAIHSPLIIKIPGEGKPAKINEVVEFVDIYPTLCQMAGFEEPGHLQGSSLLSLIEGKGKIWKNTAFCEWNGARTILTERYSYSFWFEEKNKETQMLFDHKTDPAENENVADQAENTPIIAKLKHKIDSLYSTY